jgi:bifunctional non-homologous end joining protein LigD
VRGEPFDSAQHLFEVKWDGVRAVAAVQHGRWQVWGRDLMDYQLRYPELEVLGRLPSGTVLDGELVVLENGRPTLQGILGRHQLLSPRKIQYASRQRPVTYVLFDLLYWQGRALLEQPLSQRRARLEELLQGLTEPRLAFSAGVVGPGRALFAQAVAQGHEGVMAKYLAGPYLPGRRVSSWRKIKPRLVVPCVIIGYTAGRHGVQSLVVAGERQGLLQYAAGPGSPGAAVGPAGSADAGDPLFAPRHLGGAGDLLPGALPGADGPGASPQRLFSGASF